MKKHIGSFIALFVSAFVIAVVIARFSPGGWMTTSSVPDSGEISGGTDATGDARHDASPSDIEIADDVVDNGWLASVYRVERTPDWQSPVFDIVTGRDADGVSRVCVVHYPEEASQAEAEPPVQLIDAFPLDEMLTLADVRSRLKELGHSVPDTGVTSYLTPVGSKSLAWQLSWEETGKDGYVQYRFQVGLKSGELLESYRYPEETELQ